MKRSLIFAFVLLALSICTDSARAQGTAFSYQGRLNDAGAPANGLYDFTFSLFGVESGGAALAGPTSRNAVSVSAGVFNVTLDFGANAFTGPARWLEIQVRKSGVGALVALTPRSALLPTPYSVFATSAGNVPSGSIAPDKLAAANAPTAGRVLTYDGTRFNWANPTNAGNVWSLNGAHTYYNAGNVGIGLTDPAHKLTVRTPGSDYGIEHTDGNVRLSTYLGGSTGGGWLGTISNHKLSFFVNDGTASMTVDTTGNVGIGTVNPFAKLDVFGDQMLWGKLNFGNATRQMLNLFGDGWGIGIQTATLYSRSGGGFAWHIGGAHSDNMYDSGGGTTVATLDLTTGLDFGGRLGQHLSLWGGVGARRFAIGIQAETMYFRTGNAPGDAFVWYKGGIHDGGHRNPGGGQTLMTLDEESGLVVNSRTTTKVLTITGGADLAEPFPMKEAQIDKGSVVVIDEEHPGRLKLSSRAYDTQVAGIISGANGVNPGISLHQDNAFESGQNVALSGRVYVQADASLARIKPGDLLTTSATPGHAMKVLDPAKAQGAILGKAMSGLAEGKGLVLVLVTLQ